MKTHIFDLEPGTDQNKHVICLGVSGQGKSLAMEGYLELLHMRGWKVFDIGCIRNFECHCYSLPNRHKELMSPYFEAPKDRKKAQWLDSEVYLPASQSLLAKTGGMIPGNCELYTINSKDFITERDVLTILSGGQSKVIAQSLLGKSGEQLKKEESVAALPQKVSKLMEGQKKMTKLPFSFGTSIQIPSIFARSLSFAFNNIIQLDDGYFPGRHPTNLDRKKMKEIINNGKITSFLFAYEDFDRKPLVVYANMVYLLKLILEMNPETDKSTVVYIRDARNIFPNSSDAVDQSIKVLSRNAEVVLKEARKQRVRLMLDTQQIGDLSEKTWDQFEEAFIFKTSDTETLQWAKEKFPHMRTFITQVPNLDPGRFFACHYTGNIAGGKKITFRYTHHAPTVFSVEMLWGQKDATGIFSEIKTQYVETEKSVELKMKRQSNKKGKTYGEHEISIHMVKILEILSGTKGPTLPATAIKGLANLNDHNSRVSIPALEALDYVTLAKDGNREIVNITHEGRKAWTKVRDEYWADIGESTRGAKALPENSKTEKDNPEANENEEEKPKKRTKPRAVSSDKAMVYMADDF